MNKEVKTLGALISEKAEENIVREIPGIPKDVFKSLISNSYWPNSVPIITFRNMLRLLDISYQQAEPAIYATYEILHKSKPVNKFDTRSELWECREALDKYMTRLKEFMIPEAQPLSDGTVERKVKEYMSEVDLYPYNKGDIVKQFVRAAYIAGFNSNQHEGDDVSIEDMAAMYAHQSHKVVDGYYNTENDLEQAFLWAAKWQADKYKSTPIPPGIVEKKIPIELEMKEGRIFYIEDVREWVSQYNNKQISISKFAELLNQRAYSRDIPLNNDIVGKLRQSDPYDNENTKSRNVWNKCCDALATILSKGDKGEEAEE